MIIEFADVVKGRGNLPNQQLGVLRERNSFVVALVVELIKIGSAQTREDYLFQYELCLSNMNYQFV